VIKDILTEDILKSGKFWTHSLTLIENCTKISDGCLHCWSESMYLRNGGTRFNGKVIERLDRLKKILPTSRKRAPRVWTYWNDLFHEGVSYQFLCRFFGLLNKSDDYHIICTKRPEIAIEFIRCHLITYHARNHIIILISMENQETVNKRAPFAAQLSDMGWNVGALIEPMLSSVDFNQTALEPIYYDGWNSHLQWVICGPENGPGKRPFDPQWALSLRNQCRNTGVPFFFKANGGVFRKGNVATLELPEL